MTRAFDYIIVGAGSAGCVLANRLSADPAISVLLIEAGGWDWHPLLRVPLGVGRIWGFDRFDWGYETEPDAQGRKIEVARGKVIGGSHSINAMGYIRGHRADYDRWAAQGLSGWSYADLLPYFKRAETWEDGESSLRGGAGPMYVRRTKDIDPLYGAYIDAGLRAGHPFTDDYNGAQQHGFGWAQWTIRRGKRDSTARAYLHPVLRRRNLTVETHALASRIVLDRGRAVAVDYRRGGGDRTARAEREVIVCGGSINSPQLLMLSGIGDPDHLKDFGIATKVPAKGVGRNLQDHYSTGLFHERRGSGPFVTATRVDRLAFDFARAYVAGTGPATDVPSGFMAFVKTDPSLPVPDIQLLFRSGRRMRARGSPESSRRGAMLSSVGRSCCGRRAADGCGCARPIRARRCASSRIFSATNAIFPSYAPASSSCAMWPRRRRSILIAAARSARAQASAAMPSSTTTSVRGRPPHIIHAELAGWVRTTMRSSTRLSKCEASTACG
jgi:choline dehydrogenase-like flavoprotein